MTSRQDTPTQSPGAHRRHRAPSGRARTAAERTATGRTAAAERTAPEDRRDRGPRGPRGPLPMQPPSHYEPYLDGMFTYCLSIMCEHDAATAALGEALALAERQRTRLRDPALRRPWLYALARWACLRRLAAGAAPLPPRAAQDLAEQRRAELASLAWPEAAGTTPEQREVLELAVRHHLAPAEVALVVGLDAEAARTRLASAACEVERTRTALAVVDTGRCALVARLAGETRVLLGAALRTELVRHVDDCTVCRRTAERVVAGGPWPGAPDASAELPLVATSRTPLYAAMLHAMDAGVGRAREATPRFDRRGFPLDPVEGRDRSARRAQLRHRAVTTTVVAAVVAAPALAIWAAYRAAPLGDESSGPGRAASATEPDGLDGAPYAKAGSSLPSPHGAAPAPTGTPDPAAPTVTVSQSAPGAASATPGAARLAVTATPAGRGTAITLTAEGAAPGAAPVRWTASTSAYWLAMSARSGVLRPGESVTVTVTVDRSLEPRGSWTAAIAFAPGDAVVTLHGSSRRSVPPPVSSDPTQAPPPDSSPPTPTATPTQSSPPESSPPPSTTPTDEPPSSPPADPPSSAPSSPAQ